MKNRRKGFTMVEMLIVIVVVGVLASMMMLSSSESVNAAKASSVISSLRSLKTAALSLYTVSLDKLKEEAPTISDVWKYMNNDEVDTNYNIAFGNVTSHDYENASWYITYKVNDSVKGRLKNRAASVGLLQGGSKSTDAPENNDKTYTDADYVCLKVR